MFAAGVVRHQIHRDLQVAVVRRGDQLVHRRQTAEHRVDIARIGHVVAAVCHRRLHHRTHPQGVDT